MAVTARFYVSQITQRAANKSAYPGGKVELVPAYANGKNADWAAATPSGKIELEVNGPGFAWFQSKLGNGDVHITFEDAPDGE